tara:strand:+ start:13 stop:288 length:276 start_codon:yes stop_codon:yes gene_type:complete
MKNILLVAILVCFLNGCASYQPIIDTKGKSKFETSNASEISNDKILCEKLAKNNTTFFSNINFWILSPKAETQYTDIYRRCLEGRNHNVLN